MNMGIVEEINQVYFDMSEVANICQIKVKGKILGRNQIFELLRKNRVLQEGNNLPYKVYINLGFFQVKEIKIERPNQYTKTSSKTQVSQKGIEFIKNLIANE